MLNNVGKNRNGTYRTCGLLLSICCRRPEHVYFTFTTNKNRLSSTTCTVPFNCPYYGVKLIRIHDERTRAETYVKYTRLFKRWTDNRVGNRRIFHYLKNLHYIRFERRGGKSTQDTIWFGFIKKWNAVIKRKPMKASPITLTMCSCNVLFVQMLYTKRRIIVLAYVNDFRYTKQSGFGLTTNRLSGVIVRLLKVRADNSQTVTITKISTKNKRQIIIKNKEKITR